jgi:hypothetical protein
MVELQQRLELVDDAVNKLRRLGQKWNDRLTLDNRRFSERYLKGEIEIGFILCKNGSQDSPYLAAILKNAESSVGLQTDGSVDHKLLRVADKDAIQPDFRAAALNAGEMRSLEGPDGIKRLPCRHNGAESESCHKQETVLVEIVQLVEYPKYLVPTLVRLNGRKELYKSRAELLFFGKVSGFIFGRSLANWKVRPSVRGSTVGLVCPPRQMIQCTSQVVDSVSGNQGEGDGGLASNLDLMDFISRLRVILDSEFIRILVPECLHSGFEIFDVLVGSFDFRPYPD